MGKSPLSAGGQTDSGCIRSNNEDYFRIDAHAGLFVVADGMGGHNAGEVASRMAVDAVFDFLAPEKIKAMHGRSEEIEHSIISALHHANSVVSEASENDASLAGMGCTIIAALLDGKTFHICHAGDARGYLIANDTISRLTTDHSAVREGVTDSGKEVKHNIITMAIGFPFPHDPEYHRIDVPAAGSLLLCSDGLWSMLDDEIIRSTVAAADDADQASSELIRRANDAGGMDNITAVVVCF